jgi:DNA-binding response OmpR family regulator
MISKPILFIVDDEEDIRRFLTGILQNDFEVVSAASVSEAVALLDQYSPDAVLADVRLPGEDGISFCRSLRARAHKPNLPILMISAYDEPETRMLSFEAGADDFIAKPFRPDELCVRLHSRIRRLKNLAGGAAGASSVIQAGKLRLDLDRVEARVSADRISLGPVEFKILCMLARGLGQLRSRDEIENFVWGERRPASRALDPHINALRRKLAGSELELRTVYGAGYSLRLKDSSIG